MTNNLLDAIRSYIRTTDFWINLKIKSGEIISIDKIDSELNKAPRLISEKIKALIDKPIIGIVKESPLINNKYVVKHSSWTKYERFCKNNNLPYVFIDIKSSDWIEQCIGIDILFWHTSSSPSEQRIAESKIYILEHELGKTCFPSFHEVWQYEDKVKAHFLYQIHNIQAIPTIVTNKHEEAINIAEEIDYPIISKIDTGSASYGVEKILSKRKAKKMISEIFGGGRKTYWSYNKQKDYIYFQKFISDATFDLRIMLIGNKAFGYFRYPKENDFKASGSGIVVKKEIPIEAIKIAINVRNSLKSRQLGVDMLYSETKKEYYIIETSIFNRIDTARQLEINGIAGYYEISDIENISFREGEYWIQELAINDVVSTYCKCIEKINA